ncbi:MAG TPA: periplasmic heavy metal sensor [Thermoanaerobaculia bacterium]|nr:periplasmic heavy metal sensor [Thermoanaerobaculia bacterium]
MMIRRTMIAGFCAALLLAGAAVAERRAMGPQGMVDHLATALGLTAAQKATATQLHATLETKSTPLFQQSRQQWAEINSLLEAIHPDATEIGQKMIAEHATQAQLKALHDDFHASLRAILNADQKAKLDQMDQVRQQHRMDRPGPFGPPR